MPYKYVFISDLRDFYNNNIKLIDSLIQLKKKDFKDFKFTDFVKYLTEKKKSICIVYINEQVIATLTFSKRKDSVYLQHIFVDEKYRKKGVCRYMIDLLMEHIITHKLGNKIHLNVSVQNMNAIQCFETTGFQIAKESTQKGEKIYVIVKSLDGKVKKISIYRP